MKKLFYKEMISIAIDLLKENHTVEFTNTDYLADSSGKFQFFFKNHVQAIQDIREQMGDPLIKVYKYNGLSMVNIKDLRAYSQQPKVKEKYKNWKDFSYPPDLIEDFCRSKTKKGETLIEITQADQNKEIIRQGFSYEIKRPTQTGGQSCGMPIYPTIIKSKELGIEISVCAYKQNHKNKELATQLMELALSELIR